MLVNPVQRAQTRRHLHTHALRNRRARAQVLHKKSLLVWKERFFVLKGTSLSCFKKKGDAEPSRVYSLTGQYGIERAGRGGGFQLKTAAKTLRLRAPSEKEEADWISTLETVIKNEREKTTQKPHRCAMAYVYKYTQYNTSSVSCTA
jgi:PH domain